VHATHRAGHFLLFPPVLEDVLGKGRERKGCRHRRKRRSCVLGAPATGARSSSRHRSQRDRRGGGEYSATPPGMPPSPAMGRRRTGRQGRPPSSRHGRTETKVWESK
jgi:hypothetical protein